MNPNIKVVKSEVKILKDNFTNYSDELIENKNKLINLLNELSYSFNSKEIEHLIKNIYDKTILNINIVSKLMLDYSNGLNYILKSTEYLEQKDTIIQLYKGANLKPNKVEDDINSENIKLIEKDILTTNSEKTYLDFKKVNEIINSLKEIYLNIDNVFNKIEKDKNLLVSKDILDSSASDCMVDGMNNLVNKIPSIKNIFNNQIKSLEIFVENYDLLNSKNVDNANEIIDKWEGKK